MSKLYIYIAIIIAAIVSFSGCKTQKTLTKQTLPAMNAENAVEKCAINNQQFTTMNIPKADIRFKYGRYDFTFRGSFRMIRDSIIIASIQPAIGIEMFRIEMTPEHFIIIDKMNRRFVKSGYNYFQYKYDAKVNFNHIQSILSNHIFSTTNPENTPDDNGYRITDRGDTVVVQDTAYIIKDYNVCFTINREYRVEKISIENNAYAQFANIEYNNPIKTNGYTYPSEIYINAYYKANAPMSAYIYINKIEFDKDIEVTQLSLNRYKPATLKQLLP